MGIKDIPPEVREMLERDADKIKREMREELEKLDRSIFSPNANNNLVIPVIPEKTIILWFGHYRCMRDAERAEKNVLIRTGYSDLARARRWILVLNEHDARGIDWLRVQLHVEGVDMNHWQIEALRYIEAMMKVYGEHE